MPTELALLPFVESRYDPFAYSSGRASGLWQFIPSTGRHFKLKENWWLDERRDIIASTQAALGYLSSLHKRFDGDWLLALAAYNAGQGTVGRAITANKRKNKPTDYWSLSLPKETQFYVPKLLAWKKIINAPQDYDTRLAKIENKPQFTGINIGSQIDLAKLADMSAIHIDTLYALNPAYNRWATDPDAPHELLFPIEKADFIKNALKDYPIQERIQWHRYTIQANDSLGRIAARYNTTTSAIKSINQLSSSTIRIGKTLLIPVASKGSQYYQGSAKQRLAKRQDSYAKDSKQRIEHTVKSGETLWSIAQQYQLSTSQIARWNNMSPKDVLRQQQKLVLWPSKQTPTNRSSSVVRKVIYTVKKGENLSLIAQKFNVAVKNIRQWNALTAKKYLQPGQVLRLYVSMADQAKKF
jgi:membrane-bound lytic murein transglycosylase D